MARLQNEIRNIMACNKLFAEKQLNLISNLQIRYDKLKKETGVFSGALLAQAVFAPIRLAPAVRPKILAEKGIGPDIALEKDKEEQDNVEENGEENQQEKPKSA